MKMKILGYAIGLGVLGVVGAMAAGCSQPKTLCTVGTATFSPYTAKFYQRNMDDPNMTGACDFTTYPGDLIGMQTYNPNGGGAPDLSKKSLAIQTTLLGVNLYPDFGPSEATDLRAYSRGDFVGIEPDGNNFCTVPQLTAARIIHAQVEPAALGAACFADYHCFSGICNVADGTCSDPLPLDSPCAEDYHCTTGVCNVSTESCSDPLAVGDPCTGDGQCASGICDVEAEACSDPLPDDAACGGNNHCTSGFCNPISAVCGAPQCCGDGVCVAGTEDQTSCAADCGDPPACGDGACNGTEDCATCPEDGCCCGDGTCDAATENCVTCAADCTTTPCGACGDAVCDAGEDCTTCPGDCAGCCGNGQCEATADESCASCEDDCGACAQPALGQQVEWANVQIYVTPAYLGTQAQGTMTYTDEVAGCSATYNVVMLWPSIGCEKVMFLKDRIPFNDADVCAEAAPCDPYGVGPNGEIRPDCVPCDPAVDGDLCMPLGVGEPESKLCDAEPDLEAEYGIPTGSGISPDFNVECDPILLECTLIGETIPIFK